MNARPFIDYKREACCRHIRRKQAREPWGVYWVLALVILVVMCAGY